MHRHLGTKTVFFRSSISSNISFRIGLLKLLYTRYGGHRTSLIKYDAAPRLAYQSAVLIYGSVTHHSMRVTVFPFPRWRCRFTAIYPSLLAECDSHDYWTCSFSSKHESIAHFGRRLEIVPPLNPAWHADVCSHHHLEHLRGLQADHSTDTPMSLVHPDPNVHGFIPSPWSMAFTRAAFKW